METVKTEPWKPLTKTEERVLALMIDGPTIQEIAERLEINPRTAKYYSDQIRAKFAVESRRELIRIARARAEQASGS